MSDSVKAVSSSSTRHLRVAAGLSASVALTTALLMLGGRALNAFLGVETSGAVRVSDVVFYLVSSGVLVGAAGVAFTKNIVSSALSLLMTLLMVGGLFIFVRADYLAVTQLLLYVGGVMVLILFAVMLTHRIDERGESNPRSRWFPGAVAFVAVVGAAGAAAVLAPWGTDRGLDLPTTAERLGELLLGHYLLVFEILSLLLLGVLVGAVVVARREPQP